MENLHRFSRATTIHGWYQVFGSVENDRWKRRMVTRMFWGLVLAFCWSFLIYYCSINIVQHYKYPIATSSSISTRRLPMPAITVFNVNELRLSHFTPKDILHTGRYLLGINDNFTAVLPEAKKYLNETQVEDILEKTRNATALIGTDEENGFDAMEFIHRVGHQREGMITQCKWSDGFSEETADCQAYGNITQGLVYLFGNTYTINRNQTMILKEAGFNTGLEFILDTEGDEYLPFIRRTEFIEQERHGLFLVIHNPVDSFLFANHWYYLNENDYNQFIMNIHSVKMIKHLPPPWGNCYDGPDSETYVSENCVENCLSRKIMERFGCILYDMASWNYKKTCINFNNDYELSQRMRYNGKYVEKCKQECPISCTEWIYKADLARQQKVHHFSEGRIDVKVGAFDGLEYEIVHELPLQDSVELLAELGGMAGLFLGASVISLLDLLLFVLSVMKNLARSFLSSADMEHCSVSFRPS